MQKISIRSTTKGMAIKSAQHSISIDANSLSFKVLTKSKDFHIDSKALKFFIKNKKNNKISIDSVKRSINIQSSGKRGLPGPKGEDGIGVPTGGLAGQVLVKQSNQDNDTIWGTITGSDKYYIQNFIFQDEVFVAHNLFKYPAVTVHDSAGDEVEGQIEHIDINSLRVYFTAPFSGRVTCS